VAVAVERLAAVRGASCVQGDGSLRTSTRRARSQRCLVSLSREMATLRTLSLRGNRHVLGRLSTSKPPSFTASRTFASESKVDPRFSKKVDPKFSEYLAQFCPDLNEKAIKAKIAAGNEDENPLFRFLRAFVPFYHDLYNQKKKDLGKLLGDKDIGDIQGFCVGDAHPENFGVLVNRDKKPRFSMNDVDDCGQGYVAADVLRFFTACRIGVSLKDKEFDAVISAYKLGISDGKGNDPPKCPDVEKMLEKKSKAWAGDVPLPKDQFGKKTGGLHIKPDEDMKVELLTGNDADKDIFKRLRKEVARRCYDNTTDDDIEFDAVRVDRDYGGSGGLERFLTVSCAKKDTLKDENILVLEFKQITLPGVFPLGFEHRSHEDRLNQAFDVEVDGKYPKMYQVWESDWDPEWDTSPRKPSPREIFQGYWPQASTFNKTYLLRPRYEALKGIKLKAKDPKKQVDLPSVVVYEAYALGQIHLAADNKDWIKAAKKIDNSDWVKATEAMVTLFDKAVPRE
jgi:hypothetical protein